MAYTPFPLLVLLVNANPSSCIVKHNYVHVWLVSAMYGLHIPRILFRKKKNGEGFSNSVNRITKIVVALGSSSRWPLTKVTRYLVAHYILF